MDEDQVLANARNAVAEARRLIAKAEEALQNARAFNERHGMTPDVVERYMQEHLTSAQRREVELKVEQALQEVRDEAERLVQSQKKSVKLVVGRYPTIPV